MRARPEQLTTQPIKTLAPIYLLTGDEPLQLCEAGDAIRAAARQQGYTEREVFDIEGGFDWESLLMSANSLSLFATRRLLELRLRSPKLGKEGGAALVEYAKRPPEDTVLLISAPKFEKEQQKSAWFGALEEAGTIVESWSVDEKRLPAWIEQRMRARHMQPTRDAVQLLAERVEGHLLAAAQEIDKLGLLVGSGPVTAEQVAEAVVSSARFDVFGLSDAALAGDTARVVRMLDGLRSEGEEPVLVLWALAREVRTLSALAHGKNSGESLHALFAKHRVWDKRKPLFEKALSRHSAARWRQILRRCGTVDRVIKGRETGNTWDELVDLALLIGGTMPPGSRKPAVGGGRVNRKSE